MRCKVAHDFAVQLNSTNSGRTVTSTDKQTTNVGTVNRLGPNSTSKFNQQFERVVINLDLKIILLGFS